jgi:hypothetical protein
MGTPSSNDTATLFDNWRPILASNGRNSRLGHTKIESTVRYLGIEVDEALAIAEQVEV